MRPREEAERQAWWEMRTRRRAGISRRWRLTVWMLITWKPLPDAVRTQWLQSQSSTD